VVGNDDAGTITFAITADDAKEGLDDDDLILVIDADRDAGTGNPDGFDHMLSAQVGPDGIGSAHVSRWQQNDFRRVPTSRVSARANGDVYRLSLDRHFLGDTDGFGFQVGLWEVTSIGGLWVDLAPDRGTWTFPLRIDLARIRPFLERPARPRAGQQLRARLALRVGRTARTLASGRIVCRARIGGRFLAVDARAFVRGRAVCVWNVPADARGATVRGFVGVRVTADARSLRRRAFVVRVG
jgi:hypothetical protein